MSVSVFSGATCCVERMVWEQDVGARRWTRITRESNTHLEKMNMSNRQ